MYVMLFFWIIQRIIFRRVVVMKNTRKHRRMIAAVRIVSLVMTLVMLCTLFPATTALGDDTNQDGEVDISDATNLQAYLAEYPVQNPIGEILY